VSVWAAALRTSTILYGLNYGEGQPKGRYLQSWIDQLRWQRLSAFDKLAATLVDHLAGQLSYCRTPVHFVVVKAINGNIKALLRRDRGHTNLRYLLLKTQRQAVTKTEFIAFKTAA
jgi:transposase